MKYDKACDYIVLNAKLHDLKISLDIDLKNHELFVAKTMDNPVNKERTTLILRGKGKNINYKMVLRIGDKNE